ncbi:MAG TPA: SIMPL domain-containing protein [Chitinophagaceae bacterium]|nr:SIMPL domain-containing protein [Chitinophagaceae bacterium]
MKHVMLAAVICGTIYFAHAQNTLPVQKTISVTGLAEQEVTPDEIYIQVDLKEYDKRGVGKIGLDDIKNNFLAACKNTGIADSNIAVKAYDGAGNYWEYRRSRKKNPDLKAGISYWVKVNNPQAMDDLVDKLDDEATTNFFIAKVDYSKRTELKKQLKIQAVQAAKAKAEYLTHAIGENIGGAVTITDDDDNSKAGYYNVAVANYVPQRRLYNTEDMSTGGVAFKKIQYQFQVSVVFALQQQPQ